MSDLAEDPKKTADELGLEVVTPTVFQLFIDIDSDEDEGVMREMIETLVKNGVAVKEEKWQYSKSGNKHFYLSVPVSLSPLERICLQACLGSDRKRELLSLLRVWQKTEREPTVFFEKPQEEPVNV